MAIFGVDSFLWIERHPSRVNGITSCLGPTGPIFQILHGTGRWSVFEQKNPIFGLLTGLEGSWRPGNPRTPPKVDPGGPADMFKNPPKSVCKPL